MVKWMGKKYLCIKVIKTYPEVLSFPPKNVVIFFISSLLQKGVFDIFVSDETNEFYIKRTCYDLPSLTMSMS